MKSYILIFTAFLLGNTVFRACGQQVVVSFAKNAMWNDNTGYLTMFLIVVGGLFYFREKIVKVLGS